MLLWQLTVPPFPGFGIGLCSYMQFNETLIHKLLYLSLSNQLQVSSSPQDHAKVPAFSSHLVSQLLLPHPLSLTRKRSKVTLTMTPDPKPKCALFGKGTSPLRGR